MQHKALFDFIKDNPDVEIKMQVTREESEEIQGIGFAHGLRWRGGEAHVKNLEEQYLFIHNDKFEWCEGAEYYKGYDAKEYYPKTESFTPPNTEEPEGKTLSRWNNLWT